MSALGLGPLQEKIFRTLVITEDLVVHPVQSSVSKFLVRTLLLLALSCESDSSAHESLVVARHRVGHSHLASAHTAIHFWMRYYTPRSSYHWWANIGALVNLFLSSWKASLDRSVHSYVVTFRVKLVREVAILEKF